MASPFPPQVRFRRGQLRRLQQIGTLSEDERMKRQRDAFFSRNRSAQAGMTLIETMVALAILLIVAAGVIGIAAVAVSTTETQGHLAARTAEYAQDKMEQLLALKFCDGDTNGTSGTDTTV